MTEVKMATPRPGYKTGQSILSLLIPGEGLKATQGTTEALKRRSWIPESMLGRESLKNHSLRNQ